LVEIEGAPLEKGEPARAVEVGPGRDVYDAALRLCHLRHDPADDTPVKEQAEGLLDGEVDAAERIQSLLYVARVTIEGRAVRRETDIRGRDVTELVQRLLNVPRIAIELLAAVGQGDVVGRRSERGGKLSLRRSESDSSAMPPSLTVKSVQ